VRVEDRAGYAEPCGARAGACGTSSARLHTYRPFVQDRWCRRFVHPSVR